MDGGPEGPERTVKLLAARVLGTNFAAIHVGLLMPFPVISWLISTCGRRPQMYVTVL